MASFLRPPPTLHQSRSLPDLADEKRVASASTKQSIFTPFIRFLKYPGALNRVSALSEEETAHQVLLARLQNAQNYDDWHDAAIKLDELQGNHEWKSHAESPDYDAQLVQSRLKQLEDARVSGNVGRMLFLIRTTLVRNLGDMGNIKLYKHSYTGTKKLIEAYIETALQALDSLVNSPITDPNQPSQKKILESLISTRQSYGRTALLLSGGATFGMNHVGVLKSLWEAQLLPRIISGASAGAIVASVVCTQTDDEIPATLDIFPYGDLDVFESSTVPEGITDKIARFLKIGAFIDIKHLIRVMQDILGDVTFQEAYNRTRRILNICVSPSGVYELPKLLNYITAPNVLVWSAVAASCSVPFLFSSAELLAKDPKTGLATPWNPSPQRWIDGSVDNDLPMARLAELFNVNHFIVSQVNPHVVPFLAKEELDLSQQSARDEANDKSHTDTSTSWKDTLVDLAVGEALHRMTILAEMGIFNTTLTKVKSVLSQKYAGDITIFPKVSYSDFPRMLKNPTPEFMLAATLRGEQATWPRLSRIKNHCAVELALDRVIHEMRTRVIFSQATNDIELCLSPETDFRFSASNFKFAFGKPRPKQRRWIKSNDPVDVGQHGIAARPNGPGATTGGFISPLQTKSPTTSRSVPPVGRDYFSSRGSMSSLSLTPTSVKSFPMTSKSYVHLPTSSASLPAQLDGGERVGLKRINSRYRIVRQTPSSELDPADAEDETSAIKLSSSSDASTSSSEEDSLEVELIDEDGGLATDESEEHITMPRRGSSGSLRLKTSPSVLPNDASYFMRMLGSPIVGPVATRPASLTMTGRE